MTVDRVAGLPVRDPEMAAAARHYGMAVETCVSYDPRPRGARRPPVRGAKADLVPTSARRLRMASGRPIGVSSPTHPVLRLLDTATGPHPVGEPWNPGLRGDGGFSRPSSSPLGPRSSGGDLELALFGGADGRT